MQNKLVKIKNPKILYKNIENANDCCKYALLLLSLLYVAVSLYNV